MFLSECDFGTDVDVFKKVVVDAAAQKVDGPEVPPGNSEPGLDPFQDPEPNEHVRQLVNVGTHAPLFKSAEFVARFELKEKGGKHVRRGSLCRAIRDDGLDLLGSGKSGRLEKKAEEDGRSPLYARHLGNRSFPPGRV